jgi:hypothetical protein
MRARFLANGWLATLDGDLRLTPRGRTVLLCGRP